MSKHTKGPWSLIKQNGCNLYGGKSPSSDWFIFENALEKDAKLIAAAPDLLEACIEAKMALEYLVDELMHSSIASEAITKLAAAIQKAEGGQP
jgi:hypothetical protein